MDIFRIRFIMSHFFITIQLSKVEKIKLLLPFIIFTQIILNAQTVGDISVKTWMDGRKSAFSLSFDDALQSQIDNAAPILENYGFKGTFYLNTEVLDNTDLDKRAGNWAEFNSLALKGHEMGAHSVTHEHLTEIPEGDENTPGTLRYEIYQSKVAIENHITSQKVLTFAYPFAEHNALVEEVAGEYFEASRIDGATPNNVSLNNAQWNTLKAKEAWFSLPRNSVSDDDDELNDMISWTENSINKGKWGIYFAHEVVPFNQLAQLLDAGYWFPVTNEWLDSYCQWLKTKSDNEEVWIATVAEVTKYIKERDNFSYQLISSSNSYFEYNVTDQLDNTAFDSEITIDIYVPSTWTMVTVMQGGVEKNIQLLANGSTNIVRTNVLPDGGSLIVRNDIVVETYSLSGQILYHNNSNSPVANAKIIIAGPNNFLDSTFTDAQGNYTFQELPNGNYSISISKSDAWGGVNTNDAFAVIQAFNQTIALDSLQFLAADVNNNGVINANDAFIIQRRFLQVISNFSKPDWLFFPKQAPVSIANGNVIFNAIAITTGDANGSYTP